MKLRILSIVALSSLMFSSCDSWLDVKPEGTPNESNFWQSDKDYSDAMEAVYGNMSKEEQVEVLIEFDKKFTKIVNKYFNKEEQ